MPRRARRGTRFTRRGVRKGSRKTRIRIEQPPDRPFKLLGDTIRGDALDDRDPSWWVLHRKGVHRPWVGQDPLEARAVSENKVRGYLHERILYKKFISFRLYPGSDFDFQSSMQGGRMEMGGLVVDFIFPYMRLAVRVQGPNHSEFLRSKKDEEQASILEEMGYYVLDITLREIEDEYVLDQWVRRYFTFGGHFSADRSKMLAGKYDPDREFMQELRGRGGAVAVKLEKISSILELM